MLFDTLLGGNTSEFLDKTCPTTTRGMGLPYGKKFHDPDVNRFSMIHPSDGRMGDSIYVL